MFTINGMLYVCYRIISSIIIKLFTCTHINFHNKYIVEVPLSMTQSTNTSYDINELIE